MEVNVTKRVVRVATKFIWRILFALEALKLAANMRASYYHPDALHGLVCDVSVDFSKIFRQIGRPILPDTINAANAVTIQVHSNRGKTPWIAYGCQLFKLCGTFFK